MSPLAWPLVALVYAYRVTLGPFLGGHCRFHPSCSQYALDALATHPPHRALVLTVRRLLRCHPWGGQGFDPVPPRAGAGRPYDPANSPKPVAAPSAAAPAREK